MHAATTTITHTHTQKEHSQISLSHAAREDTLSFHRKEFKTLKGTRERGTVERERRGRRERREKRSRETKRERER